VKRDVCLVRAGILVATDLIFEPLTELALPAPRLASEDEDAIVVLDIGLEDRVAELLLGDELVVRRVGEQIVRADLVDVDVGLLELFAGLLV